MPSKLAADIRQSRPFASLAQEAWLTLVRLESAFAYESQELFRAHGLSAAQYNVLRILRGAGGGGLPCGDIGERMVTRAPDMTRLLDRLESRGLITRERDRDDRRVVTARVAEAGRALLETLDAPVLALHERQLGHLGEAKLRRLLALLEEAGDRPDADADLDVATDVAP